MKTPALTKLAVRALEDLKAQDLLVLDVKALTPMTDVMVICTGTSTRHVKALAQSLVEEAKHQGVQPLGVEGLDQGEWALVDLNGVLVHVMQAQVRAFYQLEKLWQIEPPAPVEPAAPKRAKAKAAKTDKPLKSAKGAKAAKAAPKRAKPAKAAVAAKAKPKAAAKPKGSKTTAARPRSAAAAKPRAKAAAAPRKAAPRKPAAR
jgi:ribosome-associated protein